MATYLLDSHALLWAVAGSRRLSRRARELIADPENRILVSQGTVWKLSIKVTIGKLDLPEEFFATLADHGYETLPLRDAHLAAYRALPLLHRDPFDRLLVAQAQVESLRLITADPEIRHYAVQTVW